MHRRRAVVVAALALGLAGCGGEKGSPSPITVSDGGVTTTLARTVTGAVDLRRLVVTTVPAGYDLLPSPPYGAVDQQRLLAEFSDAPTADRVILEDAGFHRGYTRGWQRTDPKSFIGVFVFEFADEAGAREARERFAAQNQATKGAVPFTVEGIPDAAGLSYTHAGLDGAPERVHLVTFVRGPRLYQVGGQFAGDTATVDETVAFAQSEAGVAG